MNSDYKTKKDSQVNTEPFSYIRISINIEPKIIEKILPILSL